MSSKAELLAQIDDLKLQRDEAQGEVHALHARLKKTEARQAPPSEEVWQLRLEEANKRGDRAFLEMQEAQAFARSRAAVRETKWERRRAIITAAFWRMRVDAIHLLCALNADELTWMRYLWRRAEENALGRKAPNPRPDERAALARLGSERTGGDGDTRGAGQPENPRVLESDEHR